MTLNAVPMRMPMLTTEETTYADVGYRQPVHLLVDNAYLVE